LGSRSIFDALTVECLASCAVGVPHAPIATLGKSAGHEPKPGSDVGRPDTASWQYGRPAGVPLAFQISENNVEPAPSNCRLNLLSKHDCRTPDGDERKPLRPQVAFVIARLAFAGGREGLAGAGTGPNRSVVGPSGEPEGDGPPSDPGEEVTLSITAEIICGYVLYVSLIHIPARNLALSDEISEPLRGIGVVLVVVGGHFSLQTGVDTAGPMALWSIHRKGNPAR
jgi:hypothetical protein